MDPERIAALMTPQTRLVSLTCPHNPTGAMMDEATLRQIVALVEDRGTRLLLDETYRDMTYGRPLPVAAGMGVRAISVSSLSKTYGMPGLRTGWIVCRDRDLMETFLAAKEQISLADSVVDQALALAAYRRRPERLDAVRASIAHRVAIVREWVAGQGELEWVEPEGGVVCFPRIRPDIEVDVDRFYRILNEEYGTYVGPGHWFEQSRRHMRIGFGWPTEDDLRAGLANVSRAIREARHDRHSSPSPSGGCRPHLRRARRDGHRGRRLQGDLDQLGPCRGDDRPLGGPRDLVDVAADSGRDLQRERHHHGRDEALRRGDGCEAGERADPGRGERAARRGRGRGRGPGVGSRARARDAWD